MSRNITHLITIILVGISLPGSIFAASGFSVSPLIIEYASEERDIINRDLTITNSTDKPIRLYASVHQIEVGDQTEVKDFVTPSMTDRATDITSWISITRARLELKPQGTLTVPLTIRVHPSTPPGTYHALIGFASGPNRDEIEKKVKAGDAASVILKITIAENTREQIHIASFAADRFSVKPESNDFSFTVENTGDVPLTPQGEIIIYDTTGKELTAVPANSAGITIAPGERTVITEPLPFINRIGRNKAYLSLTYGQNSAAVFDTAFYYSMPWYYLAGLFTILTLFLSFIAYAFRRAFSGGPLDDDRMYDVPVFVRDARDHTEYDHDLDLKNGNKES
jgi:hypothetical protein